MESVRMRSASRIVAAPDRAARYQALHRHRRRARSDNDDSAGALTRTEHTGSVRKHTREEKHTTVSTDVSSRGSGGKCSPSRIVLFSRRS